MKIRFGSIGVTLMAITGGLALMVGLLAAERISASLNQSNDMHALSRATEVTNQLFEASEAAAFERDVAIAALNASDADTRNDLRPRLAAARRQALQTGRIALASLAHETGIAGADAAVRAHLSAMQTLRAELDSALQNPRGADNSSLARRWQNETAGLINDVDELWLRFVRPYTNRDAVATQQLSYNQALRTIYDYSGRERSLVSQVLSGGAEATAEDIGELNRGQGVLDANWRMSYVLATQAGFYPPIRQRYSDAKSQYDSLHGMLHEAFYGSGAGRRGALPISADLWLELSDQYLDALDSLRTSSRDVMRTQLNRLIATANGAIVLWSFLFAAALVLCVLSFLIVRRRVVQPIQNVVEALVGAAHGERVQFTQTRGQADEITELVEVLKVFEEQVETIRSTAALLDANERRLRAVVDNAVDGLFSIDAQGIIRHFNPACVRIFGFSANEVVGRPVFALLATHDQCEPTELLARFAKMSGLESHELLGRRKDGEIFPLDLSISIVTLSEGTIFSAIVRDITSRKDAESALLAHASALELSNKELDDFAYIASHDLKEPLRGIHNHARFLLEDNAELMNEESIRRLNRLVTLSQRMERLVNDLLYFSRLGRQDLAIQGTDVGAVITDIEGTLDHFLEERGARIIRKGELPTIICDNPRVTELFRNLITNAVKYNDKTEKLIEIGALTDVETPSGSVAELAFYVKDNGFGIAPEFHHEVFRIFKRLQNRASEADGTGVGLTFVKKIVERHGGEIWIESTPGEGATFLFTLEKANERARARAA